MDWKDIDDNLSKRKSQSLATILKNNDFKALNCLLMSANDLGVIRNGGRRGAALGPKVILAQLKKFANHQKISELSLIDVATVAQLDFTAMQEKSSATIKQVESQKIIHLGGGHDHVYPLVKGLNLNNPLIINIDAHLDTRNDKLFHSGTPFRQIANEMDVKILQIGIHEYANIGQNYEGIKMDIIDMKELRYKSQQFTSTHFLEDMYKKHDGDILFSIDADAIKACDMQSVSAVNHDGIPLEFLRMMIDQYQGHCSEKKQIMGIYEYNPLFDELSAKDARSLASLIYDFLIR